MSTTATRPVPSPRVQSVTAYSPPRHGAPIDLYLDGNEGAWPDEEQLAPIAAAMPGVLRRYPSAAALTGQLAALHGIDSSRVLVTAGGDESIDRLCRAFLDPGREIIVPKPTFVMIERYARLAGATIRGVEWMEERFPIEAVLAEVSDGTAMIAVVTPNNPTGFVATADDLKRLSDAASHAVLLVDLAYTEFADEDLTAAVLELPNAVAVRTLSKAWGLAGLRVGYALGPADIIAAMRASAGPYSVSGPSLAVAAAALQNPVAMQDFVAAVRRQRSKLCHQLLQHGVAALPSQGNFVAVRDARAPWLRDGLASQGIAVRLFSDEPELGDFARVTVPGRDDHFERLTRAIDATLVPQAILFDMDGVLADVSGSFREATIRTAASFGAAVTRADISACKAAGNANNDWVVTRRLLARAGIEVTLEEVVVRFEEFYQGTDEVPGLYKTEQLACRMDLLERLAKRLPLAIVTGRPRRDAHKFLSDFGLSHLFPCVIVMEDGPLKPDPAPVAAAMAQLGVTRAWMIGDTPDDVRSARAAGAIPIGVVAPGEDRQSVAPTLTAAGAARVLAHLTELENLLP